MYPLYDKSVAFPVLLTNLSKARDALLVHQWSSAEEEIYLLDALENAMLAVQGAIRLILASAAKDSLNNNWQDRFARSALHTLSVVRHVYPENHRTVRTMAKITADIKALIGKTAEEIVIHPASIPGNP